MTWQQASDWFVYLCQTTIIICILFTLFVIYCILTAPIEEKDDYHGN